MEWFADGITAVQDGTVVQVQPATGQATPLSNLPGIKIADEQSGFLYPLSQPSNFLPTRTRQGCTSGIALRARVPGRIPDVMPDIWRPDFTSPGTAIRFSTACSMERAPYSIGKHFRRLGGTALNNGLSIQGPVDLVGPTANRWRRSSAFALGHENQTARNYLIDTQSGPARLLLPPGGVGPVGWWSPDGRRMVYVLYQGDTAIRSGIARIPNESEVPREVRQAYRRVARPSIVTRGRCFKGKVLLSAKHGSALLRGLPRRC